jgi:hypothetical protein
MTHTPPEAKLPKPRPPLRVFFPMIAVFTVFALYSGYWYIVAGKLRTALDAFAISPHQGDVALGWSDLTIGGYPYRIAATFTAPVATAPLAPEDWSWQADSAEVDFLPYNFHHLVLKIGGEQTLQYKDVSGPSPKQHILRATAAGGTWASYVDVPGTPIGRLAVDIDNLVAEMDGGPKSGGGQRFAAGRLQLHMRPAEESAKSGEAPILASLAGSYDLALQGDDMAIDRADALPVLGPKIDLIAVQARLRNVPRSEHASLVELSRNWLQRGGALAVSDLVVKWGPLDMWAQGELTLDADARPKGTFEAEIANYPGLVEALVKARLVRDRDAQLAKVGLGLVAELQGTNDGRIRVPIVMTDGKLYLGPLFITKLEPVY